MESAAVDALAAVCSDAIVPEARDLRIRLAASKAAEREMRLRAEAALGSLTTADNADAYDAAMQRLNYTEFFIEQQEFYVGKEVTMVESDGLHSIRVAGRVVKTVRGPHRNYAVVAVGNRVYEVKTTDWPYRVIPVKQSQF